MSNLWVEIEALVLDGVPLDAVQGRRLAQLTEIALARLLDQRGTVTRLAALEGKQEKDSQRADLAKMKVPAGANEARWAEELALILYRAVDRTL
jgi:hypothetical protein